MPDDEQAVIEALAEAWASIDGRAVKFRQGKTDQAVEDEFGHYQGYMAEAAELIRRLEKRGYTIRAIGGE